MSQTNIGSTRLSNTTKVIISDIKINFDLAVKLWQSFILRLLCHDIPVVSDICLVYQKLEEKFPLSEIYYMYFITGSILFVVFFLV